MAFGSDLALRLIIAAKDLTGDAVRSAREGIQSISATAEKVFGAVKSFLSYKVSVEGAQELIDLADKYQQLQARLQLVARSEQEYATAQQETLRIAQATRTDLESVVALYTKVDGAIRALGGTQQEALRLTEAISQAFQISGASTAETAAGVQQLSQALAAGVLRGDEFNSVMENATRLAQAMADGLGVPVSALRAMAEQGELTAQKITQALLGQADAIAQEYAQIPQTVGGAFQRLENSFLAYVGQVNQSLGITQKLSQAISFLADHLGQIAETAAAAGIALAGQYAKGLTASLQAKLESIRAAREHAQAVEAEKTAALDHLKVAAQEAELRAKLAQLSVTEARANLEAATSVEKRAAAEAQLNRALEQAAIAREQAAKASAAYQAATQEAAAKTTLMARAVEFLGKAFDALTFAPIAYEIGKGVGEMLNQFELVRKAGTYLAEVFVLLKEGTRENFRQIHSEFEALRANIGQESAQAAQSTEALTQAQMQLKEALASSRTSIEAIAAAHEQARVALEQASAAKEAAVAREQAMRQALAEGKITAEQYAIAQQLAAQAVERFDRAQQQVEASQLSVALDDLQAKAQAARERADILADAMQRGAANADQVAQATRQAADAQSAYSQAISQAVGLTQANVAVSESALKTIEAQTQATEQALQSQLELAKAHGDEAEILRVTATLAEQQVRHAQALAQAKADLAQKSSDYAAMIEREAAANGELTAKEQEAIASARADAETKRAQAEAARQHLEALTQLPRSLETVARAQGITTQEVLRYRQEAEAAIATVQRLEAAHQRDAQSTQALADAKARAAGALAQYRQAVADLIDQQQDALQVAQRETDLIRQGYDVRLRQLEALQAAARARGDEAQAAQIGLQIAQVEAQQAQAVAQAKHLEAEAAYRVAEAKRLEAEADGLVTQSEAAAIISAQQLAEAKRLEAEASAAAAETARQEAQAKSELAQAAQEVKDATNQAADAADDFGAKVEDVRTFTLSAAQVISQYSDILQELPQYQDKIIQKWHEVASAQLEALGAQMVGGETAERIWKEATYLAEAYGKSLSQVAESELRLRDALASGVGVSQELARAQNVLANVTADALGHIQVLGDEDLAGLRRAIEEVRTEMQHLNESAQDTLRQLRIELAQLTGNQFEVERLHYQEKMLELEQKLAEARRVGASEAVRQYQEAIRLEEEIFQRKLANLEAEQKKRQQMEAERRQQEEQRRKEEQRRQQEDQRRREEPATEVKPVSNTGQPAEKSVVVKLDFGQGRSVAGQFSEADASRLLDMLKELQARSA